MWADEPRGSPHRGPDETMGNGLADGVGDRLRRKQTADARPSNPISPNRDATPQGSGRKNLNRDAVIEAERSATGKGPVLPTAS